MRRRTFLGRIAAAMVVAPALRWLPETKVESEIDQVWTATCEYFEPTVTYIDTYYNFICQSTRGQGIT